MKFTDEQQAVIDARNCNILVSAAAGSGKTAVLVERIIKLITEGDAIDIDRLLVVTFTKAAATQMKERITQAISQKLIDNPEDKHLQRQETLIHNAQITTIDSFCQYVIRNNFNDIGLDPGYRVADEGEMKLMQQDVMAQLLEMEYEKGDEDFLYLMDYFFTGSSDKAVEEYIFKLYNFAMSMPWPVDWLIERGCDYDTFGMEFDDLEWVKLGVKQAKEVLKDCISRYESALKMTGDPDGPYYYADLFEREKNVLLGCLKAEGFSELRDAISSITYDRLPSKKDESVNADKKKRCKDIRDNIKKDIPKLQNEYFGLSKEIILEQMQLCSRAMHELSRLTIAFIEEFDAAKRKAGVIDFSDMEHFALKVLVHHEMGDSEHPEVNEPTAAALEYRSFFKEIMIDEYQDSNNVQELILSVIAGDTPENYDRFMVGDVKQSIYKFRLARPEIFMEKLDTYSKDKSAPLRRIDLHRNFRSRSEVLDSTNYIFRQIMGRDLGGVAYDMDAMLQTGADYPIPEAEDSFAPEIYLINSDNAEDESSDFLSETNVSADNENDKKLSNIQQEALVIAHRIKELLADGKVTGKDGNFRKVKLSDIVILLRTASGWDSVIKKVLDSEGIPTYIESRTGYFSATEVMTLLQLFSVLDNALQDIPLVSVMHSYLGGFTDEELATLKAADTEFGDKFYNTLIRYINFSESEGSDDKVLKEKSKYIVPRLQQKVRGFLDMIQDFRAKTVYMPVHELLEYILKTTGYKEYVTALPGGAQRRANIEMLLQRAADFEKTNFKGVFHFVRYIEQLRQYEVDYGEANILDEHADVVRIMSIHKSKGLEFPIVFMAGLSKRFNMRDLTGDMLVDVDMGVGLSCIDSKNRVKFQTLRQQVLKNKMQEDSLGEELRILYVAMTRAKEKLIMTCTVKKLENIIENALSGLKAIDFSSGDEQPEILPYRYRKKFDCFIKIIIPALLRHPSCKELLKELGMDGELLSGITDKRNDLVKFIYHVLSADDIHGDVLGEETALALRQKRLQMPITLSDIDEELDKNFKDKFEYKYEYDALKNLYTKTTVTELKKASMEEKEDKSEHLFSSDGALEEYVPVFIHEKQPMKGAQRGTAYHRVMELLDEDMYIMPERQDKDCTTNDILKDIHNWMLRQVERGFMPGDYPDTVNAEDVLKFLKSSLGRRMAKAISEHKLFCEKPFMMGVDASRLNKDFPDSEMVLIQGVIDAWFIEDDGIIIMDYKTDHVKTGQELIDRYHVQLEYYQEALERITGKKVKEKWIYSFALASDIRL
ncbi:MAG: helicase-exonuclease AddAB subunit AddA [Butyrivibrio sp.]|nr:helicase-exonuclease AddAB subunit AddA [Butyrivibrio sp.]